MNKRLQTIIKQHFSSYSLIGLSLGTLFFVESLMPSLLPRETSTQAQLSAVLFVTGYGIGAFLGYAFKKYIYKIPKLRPQLRNTLHLVLVLAVLLMSFERTGYQATQAQALGIDIDPPHTVFVLIRTILIAWVLIFIGRATRKLAKYISSKIHKRVSRIVAASVGWAVVGILVYLFFSYLIFGLGLILENKSRTFDDNVQRPVSALKSGSQDSLVSWEGLGLKGRRFVGSAPTIEELSKLKPDAFEPIRVYVGVENESDTDKRADLLVQELERTGAFERSAIVLYTPSGTGWVNDVAVESAEYILGGDVASASLQYSTVSSFLQYVIDRDVAGTVSTVGFEKIYARLREIPEDTRPELFLYGESLGSLGSQAFFVDIEPEDIGDYIDGALWVGSPSASGLWSKLRSSNDAPVKFGTDATDLVEQGPWKDSRVAFISNNTDPVVWINSDLMFSAPEWLDDPYPDGVNARMRWRPFITFFQLAFELLSSSSVPSGNGHKYDDAIPSAMVEILNPLEWSDADTNQLENMVH